MTGWAGFWFRILSPATARFVLALLAMAIGTYALYALVEKEIVESNREALFLALGIMLGLSKDAFGYYFGSTARGDERGQNQSGQTVAPVTDPLAPTQTGPFEYQTFEDEVK